MKVNPLVHTWVRRLMKLALVPTADVPDVFIHLVETILDTVQIDPLLGYFKSREDLDCWTEWMSYRIPSCNSYCE